MTDTEALDVLDRIASGKDIYTFVCSKGNDVVKAAQIGADAVRQKIALDRILKCWEVNNDNTRT